MSDTVDTLYFIMSDTVDTLYFIMSDTADTLYFIMSDTVDSLYFIMSDTADTLYLIILKRNITEEPQHTICGVLSLVRFDWNDNNLVCLLAYNYSLHFPPSLKLQEAHLSGSHLCQGSVD